MPNKISKIKSAPFIMTMILALIILASIIWILITDKSKGETVTITSNGITLWTCDLSSVNGEITLTVINDPADENSPYIIEGNSPEGSHYNVIKITSEGACIIDSDCRNGLCIHEGITDSPAKPLVCLPNKLMITVSGNASGTDAITY